MYVRTVNRLVRAAFDPHYEHKHVRQFRQRIAYIIQRADSLGWELRQHDPNPGRSRAFANDRPDHDDRERVFARASHRREGGLFALGHARAGV
jgi:ABC-type iron transport system FetAB ATPase subunit